MTRPVALTVFAIPMCCLCKEGFPPFPNLLAFVPDATSATRATLMRHDSHNVQLSIVVIPFGGCEFIIQ